MRHTKIIATLGPASSAPSTLDALIAAGADVFRLNFSHGTHETHGAMFEQVREAAGRAGRHVAILQDLSGPKIRTGPLTGGQPVTLAEGAELRVAAGDATGDARRVFTPYAPLITKRERRHAMGNLDAILGLCNGVMVARGDLGLEMPLEQVPRAQKQIVRRARSLGRPVIVATQVLESMRSEPRPTRAEVSDA